MNKRFYQLSFVIGLFFLLVSIILFINVFVGGAGKDQVSMYTAVGFLVFSLFMLFIKK